MDTPVAKDHDLAERQRNGWAVPTWSAILLLSGVGLVGCDLTDPKLCHTGIWTEVFPGDTVISVGDSFRPRAKMEKCPDPYWFDPVLGSADTTVVKVVDVHWLFGVAPGEVEVSVTDQDGNGWASISVTVR